MGSTEDRGKEIGSDFTPLYQVSRLSSYRAVNTARLQTVHSAPCLRVLQPADFSEPHNYSAALPAPTGTKTIQDM